MLRATFPAGTVSGAPKVRAMEIIDELEPTKRGPYAGVVGYVDFSGNLDTAIAIRTMVWRDGQASVQAGAGIVADSDPRRRGPGMPATRRRRCSPRPQRHGARSRSHRDACSERRSTSSAALRAGAAAVDRSDRGSVLVSGPDAFSFLQASSRRTSTRSPTATGARSLLLTPQGKLDVAFRLLRVGDDAWLDCDPGIGAQLAASLDRFKIRVKADVVDARRGGFGDRLSRVRRVATATGPRRARARRGGRRVVRTEQARRRRPAVACARPRAPQRLTVVGAGGVRGVRASSAASRAQPVDIDETTIPQEAFLELDAVSFTKGCFLGQELVCRIDSRGHVNRFLRRFTDDRRATGPRAAPRSWSTARSSARSPAWLRRSSRPVALGYVRREVEPPADGGADGGTAASARAAVVDAVS